MNNFVQCFGTFFDDGKYYKTGGTPELVTPRACTYYDFAPTPPPPPEPPNPPRMPVARKPSSLPSTNAMRDSSCCAQ